MRTLIVSRHPGAVEWLRRKGITGEVIVDFRPELITQDDRVVGTLPVHLAYKVCARGGRYLHLELYTPPEWRGKELTPDDMDECKASLAEYLITRRTE